MRIRRAGPDDAELVARLNRAIQPLHADALSAVFKSLPDGALPAAEAWALLENPRNHILVGFDGDVPVGYVYAEVVDRPATSHRRAACEVYVHHLTIEPEHQRHGHGEAVMAAVTSLARDEGIRTVALDVWWFNRRARVFARQGFTAFNEPLRTEVG